MGIRVVGAWVLAVGLTACSSNPQAEAKKYVESGDRYVALQQFPEAILQYRNAVAKDPQSGDARLKLADTYMATNDIVHAAPEYIRAADLLPANVHAQVEAGRMLLLGRNFEDARTRVEKVLAVDTTNVDALTIKGAALAGMRDVSGGIEEVERAIDANPSRAESYATLAGLQMSAGHEDLARQAFETAVKVDPKALFPRIALTNMYWKLGKQAETERYLLEAVRVAPRNANVNHLAGVFYMSVRQPDKAEGYFKTFADVGENEQGRVALGDFYSATHRLPEAQATYRSVTSKNADSYVRAQLRLADSMGGSLPAIQPLVEALYTTYPARADVLLARAQLSVLQNKFEEAQNFAQQAVTANPAVAKAHLLLGRIYVTNHKPAEALASFTEALKQDSRLTDAHLSLARLHLQQMRVRQAKDEAETVLQQVPGNTEATLLLARATLLLGQGKDTDVALASAVKTFGASPPLYTEYGVLQLYRGNIPAARAALDKALTLHPQYPDAVRAMVALDVREKKTDVARTRIDAAIAAQPDNANLRFTSAQLHVEMREIPAAEQDLRKVISMDPTLMQAYELLGILLASEQRMDEAVAEFRALVQQRPDNVGARTVIGILLGLQHKSDDAKAAYREAIQAVNDPTLTVVAANNLAWMYADSNERLDEALSLAQAAKAAQPDSPDIADTLGWVLYKKGLVSSALPNFEEAVRRVPMNVSFQYHAGLAYQQLNQVAQAKQAFATVQRLAPASTEAAEAKTQMAALAGR